MNHQLAHLVCTIMTTKNKKLLFSLNFHKNLTFPKNQLFYNSTCVQIETKITNMDSEFARQLANARLNAASEPSSVSSVEMDQLKVIADEMGVELKFMDCSDLRFQLESALLEQQMKEAKRLMVEMKNRIPLAVAKKNVVFGLGCC